MATQRSKILTSIEASKILDVTDARVRQMAISGAIIGEKLGNAWFFSRTYIEALAKTGRPRKNGVALTLDDLNKRAGLPSAAKTKSRGSVALTISDVEAKQLGKK